MFICIKCAEFLKHFFSWSTPQQIFGRVVAQVNSRSHCDKTFGRELAKMAGEVEITSSFLLVAKNSPRSGGQRKNGYSFLLASKLFFLSSFLPSPWAPSSFVPFLLFALFFLPSPWAPSSFVSSVLAGPRPPLSFLFLPGPWAPSSFIFSYL